MSGYAAIRGATSAHEPAHAESCVLSIALGHLLVCRDGDDELSSVLTRRGSRMEAADPVRCPIEPVPEHLVQMLAERARRATCVGCPSISRGGPTTRIGPESRCVSSMLFLVLFTALK